MVLKPLDVVSYEVTTVKKNVAYLAGLPLI